MLSGDMALSSKTTVGIEISELNFNESYETEQVFDLYNDLISIFKIDF